MFRLHSNTLEIIFKSFIQPILEYGDILMPLLNRSIKGLEVWLVVLLGEPVQQHCVGNKIDHYHWPFHKIVHNIALQYLRNCLPPTVRDNSAYSFQNLDAFRLELFYKSFFPLTVREWNVLQQTITSSSKKLCRKNCQSQTHYIGMVKESLISNILEYVWVAVA